MSFENAVALGIFASYFLLIIGTFVFIVRSLPKRTKEVSQPRLILFSGLTLGSFAHTWFYMFKFMAWSFSDYEEPLAVKVQSNAPLERLTAWLLNTTLFEQAWTAVSFEPLNWCWSEQLCLFTVGAWTVFLFVEGKERNVKHVWAYMLLGQIVAVSVAVNLFSVALVLAPRRSNVRSTAPPLLCISVLVSLLTIAISPFTNEKWFLPNLLIMHTLLILPLGFSSTSTDSRLSWPIRRLYTVAATVSLVLRIKTVFTAMNSLPTYSDFLSQMWTTLHAHPAQSSIGWDVVWTSTSFVAWVLTTESADVPKWALALTPVLSLGTTAPLVLSRQASARKKTKE